MFLFLYTHTPTTTTKSITFLISTKRLYIKLSFMSFDFVPFQYIIIQTYIAFRCVCLIVYIFIIVYKLHSFVLGLITKLNILYKNYEL